MLLRLVDRYASWVTHNPRWALLVALSVIGSLGMPASTVRLDNNFSKLYATATEADQFRLYYRSVFGANDGLFIAVLTPQSLDDPKFIEFLAGLTDRVAKSMAISRVFSVTKNALPIDVDDTLLFTPLFGPDSEFEGTHQERLARIKGSPLGQRLLSEDGRRFVLAAEVTEERLSYELLAEPEQWFRSTVQDAVRDSKIPIDVLFGGIPHTRVFATKVFEGDLFLLSPLAALVLATLLFIRVRRVWAVAVSMFAAGLTAIGAAGIVGLFKDDLNFLTVLYPVLLTSITVAHSVHLLHGFAEDIEEGGRSIQDTATHTAQRIGRAAFLSSLTTAIGFASLMLARVTILRSFGLYLGFGIVVAFFVVSTVFPAALVLLGERLVPKRPKRDDAVEDGSTHAGFFDWLVRPRNAKIVALVGMAVLLALGWYAKDVRFDYILSDHAVRGSELAQGNSIIDDELGGTVPIEVSFLGEPGDLKKPEVLKRMEQSGNWLRDQHGLPQPLGLSTVLREIHKEFGGPDEVPDNEALVSQLLLVAESSPDGIVSQLVTDDFSHGRMRTAAPDGGGKYIVGLHGAFDKMAQALFEGTGVHPRMTGAMVIGYNGMNGLSAELMRSVAFALLLVLLVIALAFRSVRMAVAAVLPNVLPVAAGLALLRATGSVVNPVPGVVFCIGIGLSVDDTIHLIAQYREELRAGATNRDAVVQAVHKTKSALVTTTLALALGFLVLYASSSDVNRTFAWLGASIIVVALVTDLVVTPAMLRLLPLRPRARVKR